MEFQHTSAVPHLLRLIGYFNSSVRWCIKTVTLDHRTKFSEKRGQECFPYCCVWQQLSAGLCTVADP